MLTDIERYRLRDWIGPLHFGPGWVEAMESDPRAYMLLFDRLAREYGYSLYFTGGYWYCDNDNDVYGNTRGEVICRAALAVIASSTKKAERWWPGQ